MRTFFVFIASWILMCAIASAHQLHHDPDVRLQQPDIDISNTQGQTLDYFCSFKPRGTAKTKWAFRVIEVPYDCFTNARLASGTTIVDVCLTGKSGNYGLNTIFWLQAKNSAPNGAAPSFYDSGSCGPLYKISFPAGENGQAHYRGAVSD